MTSSSPTRIALVLGATGGFGGHTAQALIKRGWTVRALARDPAAAAAKAGPRTAIDWIAGDALTEDDVRRAASGADLIVHAVNPPGYRNWRGLAVPMLANTIAAAKATGARILFPGNVYNFAPDSGAAIPETAPQHPATRKGAIRVEMEGMLRAAAAEGVKSVVLRAGDFFGPGATHGGSIGWQTTRKKGRLTGIRAPGPLDRGYALAYLPDLGEAAARLAEADSAFTGFETFHFRGHWLDRYEDLIAALRQASGRPDLPAGRFPWALIAALSPFNETFRELFEMRYLWASSIGLSGDRLASVIGPEPHTPLDRALGATLADFEAAEGESRQAAHA